MPRYNCYESEAFVQITHNFLYDHILKSNYIFKCYNKLFKKFVT